MVGDLENCFSAPRAMRLHKSTNRKGLGTCLWGLKDFCDTSEPVNRRRSNQSPRAPIPDALSSPTNATARPMPKLRMHATGATKGIRRLTVATAHSGARSAPPTSSPTRSAKTASKLVATHPCRKSTMLSRLSTAAPTTLITFARCANLATRDRHPWTMTDGGEHPGSTPTDEPTRCPLPRRSSGTSQNHLDDVRWTRGNVESVVRGWGSRSLQVLGRSAGGANRVQSS